MTAKRFRARTKKMWTQVKKLSVLFARGFWSMRTLICALGSLLLLVLFLIAIVPVRYSISVGTVPTHTITANRDVVDEITTAQLRRNAAAAVTPTYYYAQGVTEEVFADFDKIFQQFDAAIQYSETLENYSAYRNYSADELAYARTILTELDLLDFQLRTLLNTPRTDLTSLRETLYAALQNAMTSSVMEGHETEAVSSIMQIIGYRVDNTSLLLNVVQPLLKNVVRPNMVIDQAATEAARQLARDSVEPIVYKQGQNIVVKGEGRVEKYQYDMLANLGLLSNTSSDLNIYLGATLLVVLVLFIGLFTLRLIDEKNARNNKRLVLIFTILNVTLALSILLRMIDIYLAPIALCAILLAAMLGLRTAVVTNVTIAVLISALAAGGDSSYTSEMVHLMACAIISGSISALIVYKRSNRLRIIAAGVAAGISNFLIMLALGLMTSSTQGAVLSTALWSMIGGLLSGLLAIGIQPVLEAIFNLATPTKLMELSNPNHPLLRRLLLEAPGTYHHSIVVANLAEAAAEAVGANPLLARVGGYYHDVGKLRRPHYFKENQLGADNKLSEVDPYTAAQIIIAHPRDGVSLARNYRLPKEVCTMIQEHHGNTPVMYFYSKAVQEMGEDAVDIASFRYDSQPPSTKEGALLLLCDTIEAAVRSMNNPTPDAIEEFIVKLVRGKLQDGQLSQSPLTLRDIDAICQACTTVLNGVFHERIEYPDPPAAIKKSSGVKKPVIVTTKDAEEPWDGETEKDEVISETPAPAVVPDNAEPEGSTPVIVAPEQFEPAAPLVVEPPKPAAVLSIEEAMILNDLEEAEQTEMLTEEEDDPNFIQQEFIFDDEIDEDDEEIQPEEDADAQENNND